ncbi:septum formation protein Maf [Candidatus Saganbacteria bacterium CG08_land_8_20_14_0_20_45_16]|uniref:dTTP/UTP pyrophosphatase n=1 Tax=Candidatus Saganbacteria bacterium CG08_land_8_20_14_0_20_45_16 TaxID=2014293 RepID=A0A2H0Y090_UNCSA|nr:MAG: septum formation protein Maf [Candidatus Saganbacteria bacterium CG08_land_8_20_14_0_20_45_16]
MPKKKVVLASSSPRRKELLKKIVKNFKVSVSSIDETKIKARSPEGFALKAALAKAEAVAEKQKNALVIGADTIVVLGKKILGKPKNKADAFKMLKSLCGRVQKVITGVAIVDSDTLEKVTSYEVTKVKMKKASDQTIHHYIETFKPLDKAGAYGIQEMDKVFINKIVGDYDNVVGLPVKLLKKLLGTKVPCPLATN